MQLPIHDDDDIFQKASGTRTLMRQSEKNTLAAKRD